jgi:hypothetical protein
VAPNKSTFVFPAAAIVVLALAAPVFAGQNGRQRDDRGRNGNDRQASRQSAPAQPQAVRRADPAPNFQGQDQRAQRAPQRLPDQRQMVPQRPLDQRQAVPQRLPDQRQMVPQRPLDQRQAVPQRLPDQRQMVPQRLPDQRQMVPQRWPDQRQIAPSVVPGQRQVAPPVAADRRNVGPRSSFDSRDFPRGSAVPRSNARGSGYGYRDGDGSRYGYGYGNGYGNGYGYGYRPGYRSYYSFRPRFTFSFGLRLGYPVDFPSWYDPYVPGVYRYYRPGYAYGGVSFDIQPLDAAIYVDGEYMGTVADFAPWEAPMTLVAGRHHVELTAPGYEPIAFDLTVVPHQVIPYEGTLPYRN